MPALKWSAGLMLLLAGCGAGAPPALPPQAETQPFTESYDVLIRGARAADGTEALKPRVARMSYALACLQTPDQPAPARFARARAVLESQKQPSLPGTMAQAELTQQAQAEANRLIVKDTGCEVKAVTLTTVTENRTKLRAWIEKNGLVAQALAERQAQEQAQAQAQAARP